MRLLFCIPTTALSGGVKVVFEVATRLADEGHTVEIFSFAGTPRWWPLKVPLLAEKDIAAIAMSKYDFVLVTNAFLIPTVLPHLGTARGIFFCQDYESFHHAKDKSYADFMAECPTFVEIYKLPLPIIVTSKAVQTLIKERIGRDSYDIQLAIDKTIFCPRPRKQRTELKRVLFVGNYLMPYKGMKDGFAALEKLSLEMPVQLVLATQEQRNRKLLADLPFPVEIHNCCPMEAMPEIMASCDAYCCSSWYEGLGLPALEAFRCGVPVVSTRTYGVSNYGVDGVNLLLAQPNDPQDLYEKLRRLLLDEELSNRLCQAAFKTVETDYDWAITVEQFKHALAEIDLTYTGIGPVDPEAMQALLKALEAEGNLTPIETFRHFQNVAADLDELCTEMLAQEIPTSEQLDKLGKVRNVLKPYLTNVYAQYYDAFKAKYDLCQLLFSLAGSERFAEYLDVILKRGQQDKIADYPTLSEIRYTDAQP